MTNQPSQPKARVFRILCYEGDTAFVFRSLQSRQVKGSMVTPKGTIHEAIIGDPFELLSQAQPTNGPLEGSSDFGSDTDTDFEPPQEPKPPRYICGTPQGAQGVNVWAGPTTDLDHLLTYSCGDGDLIIKEQREADQPLPLMTPVYKGVGGKWVPFDT